MTAIETNARFVLLAMLAEIELLAEAPEEAIDCGQPHLVALCREGVPFTPAAWSGGPLSPARRMAFSRAARRLAERGLVKRITHSGRDRTTCLVPTPAGLELAIALAGNKVDCGAVREGLARTCWGRDWNAGEVPTSLPSPASSA